MQVTVKLFATLRENREKESMMQLDPGANIKALIDLLGISEKDAAIIFINGRGSKLDQALSDGDTVSIFPPVGGG